MNELKSKVPDEFMCMSKQDICRFARIEVLGVTKPQIYLKVKGNWTGGHQENLRLRAANINHGPSSSLWHCVGIPKNIEKFVQLAKQRYKLCVYRDEGLWFCDPDFCLANGIELITLNQREGDLVILKPGTIHWVRSLGLTSQTAWNFGTYDLF